MEQPTSNRIAPTPPGLGCRSGARTARRPRRRSGCGGTGGGGRRQPAGSAARSASRGSTKFSMQIWTALQHVGLITSDCVHISLDRQRAVGEWARAAQRRRSTTALFGLCYIRCKCRWVVHVLVSSMCAVRGIRVVLTIWVLLRFRPATMHDALTMPFQQAKTVYVRTHSDKLLTMRAVIKT